MLDRRGDIESGFAHLHQAVAYDDNLPYDEPWGWMQPIRHALGALLPKQGRVEEALVEYRADLEFDSLLKRSSRHPDNVCSLSGYHEFLERTGLHELAAVRALAWPALERSLMEFRHPLLKASTI